MFIRFAGMTEAAKKLIGKHPELIREILVDYAACNYGIATFINDNYVAPQKKKFIIKWVFSELRRLANG